MEPEILTIIEAAEYLRISPRTLHRLIEAKRIPVKRVGGQLRFSRTRLAQWCGVPSANGNSEKAKP